MTASLKILIAGTKIKPQLGSRTRKARKRQQGKPGKIYCGKG